MTRLCLKLEVEHRNFDTFSVFAIYSFCHGDPLQDTVKQHSIYTDRQLTQYSLRKQVFKSAESIPTYFVTSAFIKKKFLKNITTKN